MGKYISKSQLNFALFDILNAFHLKAHTLNENSLSSPNHFSLDGRRFTGYFHRLHIKEDRFMFVGFWLRQQRMYQDTTSRVNKECVGELSKTKVYDRTEQRVHWYVNADDALE